MTATYRHAIWPKSSKWPTGYVFGAPLHEFKRAFPEKVRELGPPLRIWDSNPETPNDGAENKPLGSSWTRPQGNEGADDA